MRIARFYEPQSLSINQTVTLSDNTHRHGIQVLRLKEGSPLILFNGEGGEYHATLIAVAKRQSQVQINHYTPNDRKAIHTIQLCLAMIKPDKMDWAIQKAVELGVEQIQPIITERSVTRIKADRLDKKIAHWQGVIIAACEQSGRTLLPTMHTPIALEEALTNHENTQNIALLTHDHPQHLSHIPLDANKKIALYIGPEGGFTPTEEKLLLNYDCSAAQLGPLILRAETASTTAISLCMIPRT